MPSILTLEKISKRFGAVAGADNIDLTLLEGEVLGIVGRNGAGKTTLAGIVTGTIVPDGGRVVFRGQDITRATPERRCRIGIARAFQIPQPFGRLTVFENLVVAAAFGGGRSEDEVYGDCVGLLERCGLADKANRRAGSLTLLDRKRLELARALSTGPRVLLLDEVTGGLTERETAALADLVNDMRATGISIVWIEHTVHALIAVVDRLVVLHGGALIAEGDPAEVLRRPQVAELYTGIEELNADELEL
jgi:branched-chain amino acid transport system ATP-binding protein